MTVESKTVSLLQQHGLRKTNTRIDVLSLFVATDHALSHSDIESKLGSIHDRVTLYRTLHTFESEGIIHKVPDTSGVAKYAVCVHDCSSHQHYDNHVHFTCSECNNTYCLEQVAIPHVQLPKGYQLKDFSFLVNGVCALCQNK